MKFILSDSTASHDKRSKNCFGFCSLNAFNIFRSLACYTYVFTHFDSWHFSYLARFAKKTPLRDHPVWYGRTRVREISSRINLIFSIYLIFGVRACECLVCAHVCSMPCNTAKRYSLLFTCFYLVIEPQKLFYSWCNAMKTWRNDGTMTR